jgi:hypothetical protein
MMGRKAIWAAVYAKLATTVGAVTTGQTLLPYDQVQPEAQPALFMARTRDVHRNTAGRPAILTLQADFFLYTNRGGDDTIVPSEQIDDMLDAIDALFAFDDVATGRCTLGGLVQHAWIEGETPIAEGQGGAQAIAIVPVAILVNV